MHRLLLPLAILPALVLCACGSVRSSHYETVQVTGEPATPGKVLYLRISGGTPDAVLLESADQWSPVVAELDYGQEMRIIGKSSGDFLHVRTVILGFAEEGWVWRPTVSVLNPADHPVDADRWQQEGVNRGEYAMTPSGTRIDGFTPLPEEPDPEAVRAGMERYLEKVDAFEGGRARVMGDSTKLQQRYRTFGKTGGLSGD
ncbi:MAG: SH3 domain-containing protein [Planctomycetes bacterium]|nr:SH3 domain-containing protein [Planctomycetota bacterium]